jgi:hypothetical protein
LGVSVRPVSHEKVANCTRLHNVAACGQTYEYASLLRLTCYT